VEITAEAASSTWRKIVGRAALGLSPQVSDQPSLLLDVLDCSPRAGFVEVACVASECGPFNPSARPFDPFDQTDFDYTAQDHLACASCMLVKFGLERSQC
jgi:hypothetical protein